MRRRGGFLLAVGALCSPGCVTELPPLRSEPVTLPERADETDRKPEFERYEATRHTARPPAAIGTFVVAGERLPVDTLVVPWDRSPFYDAHREEPRFAGERTGRRYRERRRLELGPNEARGLREKVDLVVLHYDACGTSKRCFEVLHDQRGLSAHFLIDVDGTVYQTLDLRHEAWHARQANPRSIGIEIAHVGAFAPAEARRRFERHYRSDADGARFSLPADAGVRTAGFQPRPARPEPVRGVVQGQELLQYDFTAEQYKALEGLVAGLAKAFPNLALDAPRDGSGRVRTDVLSDAELARFRGIVGHFHVGGHKVDPGPAFAWEPFLSRARARAAQP